jgi:hypothetical protein
MAGLCTRVGAVWLVPTSRIREKVFRQQRQTPAYFLPIYPLEGFMNKSFSLRHCGRACRSAGASATANVTLYGRLNLYRP